MKSLSVRVIAALLLVSLLFPAAALATPGSPGETVHVVQWGETLSLIADRYGVTVEAILAANSLDDPNFVYVGQRLVIPISSPTGSGCTRHYTVQWGDTLSGIAWQHGTTATALMQANDLYSELIYEGQRLCVPSRDMDQMPSTPSGDPTYYTVRAGDTLAAIAMRFGVTQAAIIQANNLASASLIYIDQRLLIPGVSRGAPTSGPTMSMDGAPAMSPYYSPERGQGQPSQGMPGMQPSEMAPARPPEYQQPQGDSRMQPSDMAPARPPDYQQPQGDPGMQVSNTAPAPPPGYQPPYDGTGPKPGMPPAGEPFIVPIKQQWVGSRTAHNPDPDEITTLIVMTHEKEGVDVMIRSRDGFVARGVTGVYYEFSWIPTFAFRGIPGGEYEVWIEGQPSQIARARLDPGHRALVEFKWKLVSVPVGASPSGWIGEVVDNTSGDKPIGAFSILVVKTGNIGNKIRITAPGGFEAICITGTKPEHGPGACDMGGLNAGTYQVILDGAGIGVEVYLDGIGTAVVEFRPAPPRTGPSYVVDP